MMYDETMDVARALEVERQTLEARRTVHDFVIELQQNNPYHPQIDKIATALAGDEMVLQVVMFSIERGKQSVRATRAETSVEQGRRYDFIELGEGKEEDSQKWRKSRVSGDWSAVER